MGVQGGPGAQWAPSRTDRAGRRDLAPLKIQLKLKTYSPSRANEIKNTSMVWAREGVSERQWRSAANRPSRQARPGGGYTRLPLWGSCQRYALTEGAALNRGPGCGLCKSGPR